MTEAPHASCLWSWRWRTPLASASVLYCQSGSGTVGVQFVEKKRGMGRLRPDLQPQRESRVNQYQSITPLLLGFFFGGSVKVRQGTEPYITLCSLAGLCLHAPQQRCVRSTAYVGRCTLISLPGLSWGMDGFLTAGSRTHLAVTHLLLLWTPLQLVRVKESL